MSRMCATSVTIGFLFLLSAFACAPAAHAKQYTWKVKGSFAIDPQFPELTYRTAIGYSYPPKGIKVRISAKEKGIGIWNEWATVTTDENGNFSLSKEKDGTDRAFRIEFKFESDDLEIRHSNSENSLTKVKWYTASDNGNWYEHGTRDFGTFTFKSGGSKDLGDWEVRRHAEIWVVANQALEYMKSLGYGFYKEVKIKYPHNSDVFPVSASYSNPTTNVIYIYRSDDGKNDHFDINTIYHEMMHIWAYEHVDDVNGGKTALIEAIVANQNTHGFQEACVAFHEGFAQFGADALCDQLWGKITSTASVATGVVAKCGVTGAYHQSQLPYNRPRLLSGVDTPGCSGTDVISNLAKMQTHDAGWWSFLNILRHSNALWMLSFDKPASSSGYDPMFAWPKYGTTTTLTYDCTSPDIGLKDILRVFCPAGGYSDYIDKDGMTVDGFLKRAKGILGLSSTDVERLKEIADPGASSQPFAAWCEKK